ncbi:MAG TPA: CopD family protein [Casimicrobiaceae bacterium]
MKSLFDVFGFVTVLLHGLDLVARTVLLGSVLFAVFAMAPRRADPRHARADPEGSVRKTIRLAAIAAIAAIAAATAVNAAMLVASLDLSLSEVVGARFVVSGIVQALVALAILALVSIRPLRDTVTRVALVLLGALSLSAALADSHAAARLSDSRAMLAATFAHQLGAALWLGGLPCFRLALLRTPTPQVAARLGRRYSMLSVAGVLLVAAGAIAFAAEYIGSLAGAYGTAYGAMALTKAALLGALLLLGLHNFRAVRRIGDDADAARSIVRFVVVEMGMGFAILMAAASLTSTPPAVDLADDRVTLHELVVRWAPMLPRFASPSHDSLAIPALQARLDAEWRDRSSRTRPVAYVPGSNALPPRNAFDVAWSEYNHHWSGGLVFAIGLAALAVRTGRAGWARHWPLLFVGLAVFVFLRGDPEVWPMGEIGLLESLRDSEVVQHRLFVLLLIGFAAFEWRVQTGRSVLARSARVFPLLVAGAATLLLTHSHALGNVKEELLVETTHLPIAVLGIIAGWSRWLEVDAPRTTEGRVAAWIWPACFVAIGLILINYREA